MKIEFLSTTGYLLLDSMPSVALFVPEDFHAETGWLSGRSLFQPTVTEPRLL